MTITTITRSGSKLFSPRRRAATEIMEKTNAMMAR
jgi:hypothetical protein